MGDKEECPVCKSEGGQETELEDGWRSRIIEDEEPGWVVVVFKPDPGIPDACTCAVRMPIKHCPECGRPLVPERIMCPKCGGRRRYTHRHQTMYGMESTHMVGSEYVECCECQRRFSKQEAAEQGIPFKLD